jgi:hypothetical protein
VADKTESGDILDILGWELSMKDSYVSIARKNLLKAFYAFASVDLEGKISLKTAQKLASLGSRYVLSCPVMAPFAGALHRLTADKKNPLARSLATGPMSEKERRRRQGNSHFVFGFNITTSTKVCP